MTTTTSCAPQVGAHSVTFRFPDPHRALASVRLCQEITRPRPGPDFARRAGTWELAWDRPAVDRLEYKFELGHPSGEAEVICDPNNGRRAPGPFGERSVIEWPGYSPPRWTTADPVDPGSLRRLAIPSRTLKSSFDVWMWTSPGGDAGRPLPLLVAHDGPEYDGYSSLCRFLALKVEGGLLPPMRAALLPPVDRDHTYSASAIYARTFGNDLLPAIMRAAPTPLGHAMRVGMGASLGALAMLHLHRTKPATFGALFLQSGSYFRRRSDPQESSFARFGRVTRFVGKVLTQATWAHPIPITMTCGRGEENLGNNRAMRQALRSQGYSPRWCEVRDAHNWVAWRDAFDPGLVDLLKAVWA